MQRERVYRRDIKQEQAAYNRHKDRLLVLAKKGSFKAFKELHNRFWSRDPVDLGVAWQQFQEQEGVVYGFKSPKGPPRKPFRPRGPPVEVTPENLPPILVPSPQPSQQ